MIISESLQIGMELIFQFFFRALANKIGILVLKRPCFGDLIPDHTLVLFLPTL